MSCSYTDKRSCPNRRGGSGMEEMATNLKHLKMYRAVECDLRKCVRQNDFVSCQEIFFRCAFGDDAQARATATVSDQSLRLDPGELCGDLRRLQLQVCALFVCAVAGDTTAQVPRSQNASQCPPLPCPYCGEENAFVRADPNSKIRH